MKHNAILQLARCIFFLSVTFYFVSCRTDWEGQQKDKSKKYASVYERDSAISAESIRNATGPANGQQQQTEILQEKIRDLQKQYVGTLIVAGLALLLCAYFAIRQQKKARQLARQKLFLQTQDKIYEQIVTGIIRKLRTSLIALLVQDLLHGSKKTNDKENTGNLQKEHGQKISHLINQLHEITEIKATMETPEWQYGDIIPYIHMIEKSFEPLATQKHIHLTFKPNESELIVDFVPNYLHKILQSLLSNALDKSEEDGIVCITTHRKKKSVEIIVSDTGKGISPTMIPWIFNPQEHKGDDGMVMKTGVGLPFAKMLVDTCGGDIKVESELGKGTTFTLNFPLRNYSTQKEHFSIKKISILPEKNLEEENPYSIIEELEEAENEANYYANDLKAKILVVEYEQDIAHYVFSILKEKYNVFLTKNGQEGLERAKSLVPDIIITSLIMPVMDGLEFCRKIRNSELLGHIPIIVISSKVSEADKVKGIEAGADAYLFKPFNGKELLAHIETMLTHYRLICERMEKMTQGNAASLIEKTEQEFLARLTDCILSIVKDTKNKISVEALCSQMCMSRSQLNKKIQDITNESLITYVTQVRINQAKRILMNDLNITISEVATKCGYDDIAYFSRVFKQVTGITPTQFKRTPK